MLCTGAALLGMFFFLTLFLQVVWGYSALRAGLAYLPMTAAIGVTSGAAAQLVPRVGALPTLLTGSLAFGGGLYWLSRLSEHGSYLHTILGPTLVAGAGLGLLFVPLTVVAMAKVAESESGGGRQPAQHRPAGRRVDRPGPARHRRLHRRREQRPRRTRCAVRPAQPGGPIRDRESRADQRVRARVRRGRRDHAAGRADHGCHDPHSQSRPGRRQFDLKNPEDIMKDENLSTLRRMEALHERRLCVL
jgi:hypothetical protein